MKKPAEEPELPPGDEGGPYRATSFERGGGRGGAGYVWFSCKDANRDRILPLANLREMEPGEMGGPCSWLHFSGMSVKLEGRLTRRVAHRLFLGRCSAVYEIRLGQEAANPDEPVIDAITFLVPPPPEKPRPRHEPETRGREATRADIPEKEGAPEGAKC